jgi:hypothetical protein
MSEFSQECSVVVSFFVVTKTRSEAPMSLSTKECGRRRRPERAELQAFLSQADR